MGEDPGNRSVRWWDTNFEGFTRILFIRDNVVVEVYLILDRLVAMGGNANTTMEIAKSIDSALVGGTLGVQRGTAINVPRILAIEIPAENPARTKVEATVHIAIAEDLNDPNSAEVEIIRKVPFYVPYIGPEEQSLQLTYELIYITPGCLVISQETPVTVVPQVDPESDGLSEGFETGVFDKLDWVSFGRTRFQTGIS